MDFRGYDYEDQQLLKEIMAQEQRDVSKKDIFLNWLNEQSSVELTRIGEYLKYVRLIKRLINKKENGLRDNPFIRSLRIIIGSPNQNNREQKTREITKLKKLLTDLYNVRKMHKYIKNIARLDAPSLLIVERDIDDVLNRKIEQELIHLFESPAVKTRRLAEEEKKG